MSLNRAEHAQTAQELQENLSKVALEQFAADLGTTPEKVLAVSPGKGAGSESTRC